MDPKKIQRRLRSYHVLSFYWEGFKPILTLFDFRKGKIESIELKSGMKFKIVPGRRKFCIGRFEGEEYIPCPEKREVEQFTQCQACASFFIPDLQCIFEPKCDGSLCDNEFCKKEHVIYLAVFKDDVKVGMTGKDRIMKRLIEQGADAFSVIATLSSRAEARELEREISKRLRVSQFYTIRHFVRNLSVDVDQTVMKKVYIYYCQRIKREFSLEPTPLQFLDGYPMPTQIKERVYLKSWENECAGEVVGIKGKCLVFKKEGYRALDLSELPSRIVKLSFSVDS